MFILDKEGTFTSNRDFKNPHIQSYLRQFQYNNEVSFLITTDDKQLQLLTIDPRMESSYLDKTTTLIDFSSKNNGSSISKLPQYLLGSLKISEHKWALFFKTEKKQCVAILEL